MAWRLDSYFRYRLRSGYIYTINYYQIKSYKPTIHDVIRDRMEEMGSSYIFGFSSEVDCIESAYNAVQFKKNFFLGKSDSIQRAFNLLEERATRNYNRAIEFMKNYDFENNQNASYIIKLADSSNFVKQKLEELENLVWEVEDSTSSTDMSYINDFTQVLSNMIEKEDEEDAQ